MFLFVRGMAKHGNISCWPRLAGVSDIVTVQHVVFDACALWLNGAKHAGRKQTCVVLNEQAIFKVAKSEIRLLTRKRCAVHKKCVLSCTV